MTWMMLLQWQYGTNDMSLTLENAWVFLPHRPSTITFGMSHGWNEEPSFMMASGLTLIFSSDEKKEVGRLLHKSGANSNVVKDYLRACHPIEEFPDITHYLSMVLLFRGYESGVNLPYHKKRSINSMLEAIERNQEILNNMSIQVIYPAVYLIDSVIDLTKKNSLYARPNIQGETI